MTDEDFLQYGERAARLSERDLSKLRWRCRRGLLENDLFVERFFARHAEQLTYGQARGLRLLMDLSDNDLLDLLLGRTALRADDHPDADEARAVLGLLRASATAADAPAGAEATVR
ncbi:MAG: hypothetical protein Fur0019_15800 [Tibeticola sp.]